MKRKVLVFCISIVVAIALLIAGIAKGDFMLTRNKGAMICYECVGLGQ